MYLIIQRLSHILESMVSGFLEKNLTGKPEGMNKLIEPQDFHT